MTRLHRSVVVLLLLLGSGCIGDPVEIPDPAPLGDVDLSPGIHRATFALPGGGAMRYAVAVPALPADGSPVPLVLALHYAGAQTAYFGEDYLRILPEPALRGLGALIVAPDAPNGSWENTFSEAALLAFLDEARAAWPVDPDRIVVTGYSMGGIGTWIMAARNPTYFSAALPMAAPAPRPSDFAVDVPVYAIHGADDELFDVDLTIAAVDSLQARGDDVHLVVVDGLTHYQAQTYVDALRDAIPWLREVWEAPEP